MKTLTPISWAKTAKDAMMNKIGAIGAGSFHIIVRILISWMRSMPIVIVLPVTPGHLKSVIALCRIPVKAAIKMLSRPFPVKWVWLLLNLIPTLTG